MHKIALINMPFSSLNLPSLGLTQIQAVLDERFGEEVEVKIHYLNHDFGKHLGVKIYQSISNSAAHHNSAFGDWLFRQIAFPEVTDNKADYFARYYPMPDESTERIIKKALELRGSLDEFLDSLIDKYKLHEADIVGLTSMFTQNVACFAMMRRLKLRNPAIITIMGGANCESPMGQEIINNYPYVDFVFSGPALINLPQFIQHCLDGEQEKLHGLKGIFSKRNVAPKHALPMFGQGPPPPSVAVMGEELDLDAGVILDYGEFLKTFEQNFPDNEVEPILLFETSRGCWWGERAHCTFCGLNGESMSYRAMSPAKAIEQFEAMFKYADSVSRINCVDNILAKNYFTEVFPFVNTPENVTLFYEVKADLTEAEMEALAKVRVKTVQPGIEALATSTLKLMKKGTSSFQNLYFLKNCVSFDIHPEWNLLIGFPGETAEVYQKYVADLSLFHHFTPPSGVFPVRFDRYSPYFTKAKEYGLDLHIVDYYELIYPFSQASLTNMAYYFSDHNFGAPYFTTMAKWIGKIRKKFEVWASLWSGRQAVKPQLYFKSDDSGVVFDSRSGVVQEHQLDAGAVEALKLMHHKPKRLADLASQLGHLPDFDAEHTLNLLKEKGLVFQEHDRFISLVVPRAPEEDIQPLVSARELSAPKMPGMSAFQ